MNKIKRFAILIIIFTFSAMPSAGLAQEAVQKVNVPSMALLIGNSSYGGEVGNWHKLANSTNDTQALEKRLTELGWHVVRADNLDQYGMLSAMDDFVEQATKKGVKQTLFYYAGHGVNTKTNNYLIPINAKNLGNLETENKGVALSKVVEKIKDIPGYKVIMVDACRNVSVPTGRGYEIKGFSSPEGTLEHDTVMVFSTEVGNTASDGVENEKNSPFANGLFQALQDQALVKTRGALSDVLLKIEQVVVQKTQKAQSPISYGREAIKRGFRFASWDKNLNEPTAPTANDENAKRIEALEKQLQSVQIQKNISPTNTIDEEADYWNAIRNGSNYAPFIRYLAKYPNGKYIDIAKEKINGRLDKTDEGCLIYTHSRQINRPKVLSWEGACINGLVDGNGVLLIRFENGKEYKEMGSMANGLMIGKWISNFKSINPHPDIVIKKETLYRENEKQDNYKKLWLQGGNFYEGETEGVSPNGVGVMVYPNGFTMFTRTIYKFVGQFKDGRPHGRGISYNQDGSINYQGDFIYGFPVALQEKLPNGDLIVEGINYGKGVPATRVSPF